MASVTGEAALQQAFDRQRAAFKKDGGLSYKERMRLLKALKSAIISRKDAICQAINQDFGNRSRHEGHRPDVQPERVTRQHAAPARA